MWQGSTTGEEDGEARYYGRTSDSKCAGMNGGTSRGASGEEVIRRVNENDLDGTCEDDGKEEEEEREGGSRNDNSRGISIR